MGELELNVDMQRSNLSERDVLQYPDGYIGEVVSVEETMHKLFTEKEISGDIEIESTLYDLKGEKEKNANVAFRAHKFVLMATREYFNAMFKGGEDGKGAWLESTTNGVKYISI